MQREWDGQWALIPAPEFHVLCLLALEVRDAIRRDLINLLEEDPTFALPCSIHEIVQAELAGELVDLRTGQRRRVPQATPVAA